MRVLRLLAVLVALAFLLLLVVGFDNLLALLRSRVALFLALAPLVGLFLWSVYRLCRPSGKNANGPIVDLPRQDD